MYNYKKIINIEGIDGSGKETQAKELMNKLETEGHEVILYSFPNYEDKNIGSIGVQKMLDGCYNKFLTNPYATSLLYAIDRFLSIDNMLKNAEGKIIIFDRYVESNIMYQSRDHHGDELDNIADWIFDLEYSKLQLPKPDLTILIDLDVETSEKLRENREFKSGTTKDVYEEDKSILINAREKSLILKDKFNWKVVPMVENNKLLSIDEISDKIWNEVESIL